MKKVVTLFACLLFFCLVGSSVFAAISSSGVTGITVPVPVSQGGTGSTSTTNARTALGLNDMSVQASNNVTISGGNISGATLDSDTLSNSTILSSGMTSSTIDSTPIGSITPSVARAYYVLNAVTTTNYTLVLGDNGKLVTLSNASAITVNIPTNASVAFPTTSTSATRIEFLSIGAGIVTFVPAGGVTLNSKNSKVTLTGNGSPGMLIKLGTNTWELVGDLN